MLMGRILPRLKGALLTLPDTKGWYESGLIGALSLLLIAGVAYTGDIIRWQPDVQNWLLRLISVMVVPAFGEELLFRGILTPARGETRRPILWITVSVLLFVMWHIFEVLTVLPGANLFLKPVFLICAGLLGAACALMRYRTGSLWPAVMLHGLLVWLWQVLFDGPDVVQLMQP